MNKKELSELRELVELVIYSHSKRDAQPYISRLEFLASQVKSGIDSYLSGKVSEVVSYAKQASGQVKDKQHWISCMEASWYVLESDALDDEC